MRGSRGPLGLLALISAFAVLAFGASSAQGAFGIANWEALTCKANVDTPAAPGAFPLPQPPGQCTGKTGDPENEARWFKQAAGHPNFGITDFTLNNIAGFPEGFVKDIIVDTPEGLGVNPEAVPQCPIASFEINACLPETQVGTNYLTVVVAAGPTLARAALPVYNIVPFDGVPSMVGFFATSGPVFIVGSLDPVDQHVTFTISDIHAPPGEPPGTAPPIVGSRLVFNGQAGDGTYLTNPSVCGAPQTAELHVDSHEGASASASFTTPFSGEGCDIVPFNVDLGASASGSTDSPEPSTVDVQMPDQLKAGEPIANSHLLTAKVTLPEGAGLNPSLANGLTPCTNAQYKKGTDDPVECPESSKIGTVEVETPALDQKLGGNVYVAEPTSQVPSSGNQFRVFIHAFNQRYGVNVRLVGNVFPNEQTGQLTVVVPENPQAPFSSFKVHVNGGARGALTTPDTCGPHTTTAKFTPWARQGEEVSSDPNPQFTLDTAPGGGPCPKTLAERPFAPAIFSSPVGINAGKFTPLQVNLIRDDGNQEIKRVEVNLPPGMVAKLKGVEYCPQASINDAASRSGTDEKANPSCPSSSFVGTTDIIAGSGPAPFKTEGRVYLAGPYKGAPVSMVFVTPAVAGPYDLGNVVVRAALEINPETVEVHAISDPIPNVFGGVKLDIRSIDVSIDRAQFTTTPTTCREPLPLKTTVWGGGGNPLDPAQWHSVEKTKDIQFVGCKSLRYKPKFYPRIFGGKNQMRRGAHPKFRAILDARNGDANTRRAAFILPRATILDQSHIRTICTRVQLAANNCPKGSIYGHAKATSPLLAGKLKGPVYLTSSNNTLPDLLADLKGQVNVRLRGVISSSNGRLKTVFRKTPDVAVNKFILTMKGGDKGLLINSRNLCERQTTGFLNLKAQNSRQLKRKNLRLNIPACRGGKKN